MLATVQSPATSKVTRQHVKHTADFQKTQRTQPRAKTKANQESQALNTALLSELVPPETPGLHTEQEIKLQAYRVSQN